MALLLPAGFQARQSQDKTYHPLNDAIAWRPVTGFHDLVERPKVISTDRSKNLPASAPRIETVGLDKRIVRPAWTMVAASHGSILPGEWGRRHFGNDCEKG